MCVSFIAKTTLTACQPFYCHHPSHSCRLRLCSSCVLVHPLLPSVCISVTGKATLTTCRPFYCHRPCHSCCSVVLEFRLKLGATSAFSFRINSKYPKQATHQRLLGFLQSVQADRKLLHVLLMFYGDGDKHMDAIKVSGSPYDS